MADIPPLPPGFTLDKQPAGDSIPPLPSGFTLDSEQAAPQQDPGDLGDAIREPLLSLATGSVAMPVAGLAGIGTSLTNAVGLTDESPASVVERVQGALTYQPRTAAGQKVGEVISYPFEKLAQGADWTGDATRRGMQAVGLPGSNEVATAVNTAIQSAPALVAKVKGGNARPAPVAKPVVAGEAPANKGVPAPTQRQAGLANVSKSAPTIEELDALSKAAYKRADDAGITIAPSSLTGLKTRLTAVLKKEGIDKDLHPDSSSVLKRIHGTNGEISLSQLETLRKIANDAKGAQKPADKRLASIIVDEIDEYVGNLSNKDVVSGKVKDASALKEARDLYSRKKKAQEINELVERAESRAGQFSGSGLENALRTEFRQLAMNKKRMSRFTAEEQAAIRKVAQGGKMDNAYRFIGKFAPTGVVSAVLSGGAGAMVGGPLGAALPLVGVGGRYMATRNTKKNVAAAEELMRRGPAAQRQQAKQPARNPTLEY